MKGGSPLCIGEPEKLPGHVRCVGGRTANWDFSVFPQCVFSAFVQVFINVKKTYQTTDGALII
jgi:hypothetical protein